MFAIAVERARGSKPEGRLWMNCEEDVSQLPLRRRENTPRSP